MRRSFGALLLFWLTLLDLVHSFSFSLSPREPRYSLGNLSPCAVSTFSGSCDERMLIDVDNLLESELLDQSLFLPRCRMSMRQSTGNLLRIKVRSRSLCSGRRHRSVLQTTIFGVEAKQFTALSHVWAQVCNRPHNNNYVRMRAAAIGSGVAAFFMVACRIFARVYTKREFWWDDWCHITAGVGWLEGQLWNRLTAD